VAGDKKITPGLQGVPETLLWTLYHRAVEARRPDAVLSDPIAVDLVDSIDYPFAERFGADVSVRAQWQALRVRRFDDEIRAFLRRCPDGMVVALGEGLETQFWRVDNGSVRWLGVDLPEVVELRHQLLPAAPRQRSVACSVLDDRWLAEVDASRGLLITTQGLLMYLDPADVHGLIARCAERFPGATMLFDAVRRWFSARTMRGEMTARGYTAPPMPWGIDAREIAAIRRAHPNIADVRVLRLPRGRGRLFGYVVPALSVTPVLRNLSPIWIMRARFRAQDARPSGETPSA
jgi:O-methyltransferase involved in polyketide biosynthesis